MKKLIVLFISSLLLCGGVMAQKILLKIGSVTATGGEEVRAVDFKFESPSNWTSGGASVGAPKTYDLLVKKTNNTSSNELFKKLLTGVTIPEVVVEYYDAANVLYFKITLKMVLVSNFYWLSPECPSCLKLEHQVAFVPKQIETFDVSTGITIRYDVSTRLLY
jgi:type VI protein secretion system component Hcp